MTVDGQAVFSIFYLIVQWREALTTRNLLICAALAVLGLYAQSGGEKGDAGSANPFTSAIVQQFTPVRTNIEQAAEAMPADKYSFQISDVNPYSYWVGHAAFSARVDCSVIAAGGVGAPSPDLMEESQRIAALTDKASLTSEVQAAFQSCADTLAGMNDEKALASPQIVARMIHLVAHNNEIYGNMVEYLRANGIVPPSTANRRRPRAALSQPPEPRTTEIRFTSYDGYPMLGKLTLPATEGAHPVVIYVQTAEGMTVDVRRPKPGGGTFNYFDVYRTKLAEQNIGFFSYEGRGISVGDQPPLYEQIDRAVYDTSTIENKVRDALTALDIVRQQEGVDPERVLLMGASEGTLLAAETASRAPEKVHGLVLYSVVTPTMKDSLRYQAADGNFLQLNRMFDTNGDGMISAAEFEADARHIRARAMPGVAFTQLDADHDGNFTAEDLRTLRKPLLDAVESDNFAAINAWLQKAAAVSIPKGWLQDHFAHPPMWSYLSKLDMPVGIFQGTLDTHTSVESSRELETQVRQAGKKNIEFHYIDGADHSLGIVAWFVRGTLPEGHTAILEFIRKVAAE